MKFNPKIFEEDREHMEKIMAMYDENSDPMLYEFFVWICKSIYDIITYFILNGDRNND